VTRGRYHLDIAQLNMAGVEGMVDRAELADRHFGEPVANQLRTKPLLEASEAGCGFMPVGEILACDAAKRLHVLMVGSVLGSTEEDVALLTHNKIGAHHQVRQLVR
jgi:hypothetical protein